MSDANKRDGKIHAGKAGAGAAAGHDYGKAKMHGGPVRLMHEVPASKRKSKLKPAASLREKVESAREGNGDAEEQEESGGLGQGRDSYRHLI